MSDQHARIYDFDEAREARATARQVRTGRARCAATTAAGNPCRNYAVHGGFCRIHDPNPPQPMPATPDELAAPSTGIDLLEGLRDALGDEWLGHVKEVAAFLRRRITGDYDIDAFGYDVDFATNVIVPLIRPMYQYWWRIQSLGSEHIPGSGQGAMIVANHAGTVPADALMTRLDILETTGRHSRELAADLVFRLPIVGHLGRKSGATLADSSDALKLLARGELVAVWPEGYKGLGKNYRDRYQLKRFGRGGFVETALRAQVPIIPTAIIGSEEIYPLLFDVKVLAKLLGVPYFPITAQAFALPLLGPLAMLPLPSKWLIEYGEPIDTTLYGRDAADDPMTVFDLADQVRDTIQQMLINHLMGRRSVFF
jgi:1-acyl-sn-glycerol-3-phosphate acyltransferase